MVSLADSQVLRWLDELNEIHDADEQARAVKREIARLRRESNSLQNRRQIRKLYEKLDAIQFKPDYMYLVIDHVKDYLRACNGFKINGMSYHRLLGTNGGVKNKTIVFIADRHGDEIRKRIDNGRNPQKELVPPKFEAYKALTCSASTPVPLPRGLLVVDDCETEFLSDVIYLSDEQDGEPVEEYRSNVPVQLDESDGYGLILPSLAEKWAEALKLRYTPSGFNTRFAWEKGMVFPFDFLAFAEEVAGTYIVKDAWGDTHDIRDIDLILTTSMLKLWDSYESCDEYMRCCMENGYTFGVTKVAPQALENERTTNYQFLQGYNLSDEDIDELIAPTMEEIKDILGGDATKAVLFLEGAGLREYSFDRLEPGIAKALMIEPSVLDDPYVQSKLYKMISKRIDDAKIGVIKVHGNYSIISGDPYSLCQHIFGLEVTGLLKAGELYNKYWLDDGADEVVCFRAPMSCPNNVCKLRVGKSAEMQKWYQYIKTCTILNSWDTTAHALNGADKDGDMVMLTSNPVLLRSTEKLPAIMCIQRKAAKRIVSDEDLIQANIASFGDDIGKITNRVTSMYDVQSRFEPGSDEYEELAYRIRCGQQCQQNSIDKVKGIISKPMPKEWYDRRSAQKIEDEGERQFYISILADRKPYFMRYIYPELKKDYNTYIKNTAKKAMREFGKTIDELLASPTDELSPAEQSFMHYYHKRMPVSDGNCVVNRICRRFEAEFDRHLKKQKLATDYDYRILKGGHDYPASTYKSVLQLYKSYNKRLKDFVVLSKREHSDADEISAHVSIMRDEFRQACDAACSNATMLCDILLDICYSRSCTKSFVWEMCGDEIVENLLTLNHGCYIIPIRSEDGDIEFAGNRFEIYEGVVREYE